MNAVASLKDKQNEVIGGYHFAKIDKHAKIND